MKNGPITANQQAPLITVDNVSFSYNGNSVLEDINLEIITGDYLGLIGPNGSGKTTLLRLILGLLEPRSGKISLFGKPLHKIKDWTRLGYIPQKATQFENKFPITVWETVSLGRIAKKGLLGKFNREDRKAIDSVLSKVSLLPYQNKLIHELSGGQQQRVFIAKALASDPELLILDEPTVGIDSQSQDEFYELLTQLNKEGKTIVIVSHDISVIANEVTSLACLNKTLVYHGTPKQFIKEDYLEKLYGKDRKFIIHEH
jgi:zinc transport system ATP-binding protein